MLSSLLLMVVAVAAMAIATTATYVITTNLRENMSERLIIEDVWFNPSTGNIQVYLHNIGKISIHISAIYVNHTSQPFATPSSFEMNGHCWINVSCSWASGGVYYVDVLTTRGTHLEDYYEAP